MPSSKKNKMFITKEELIIYGKNKKETKSPLTRKNLTKRLAVKYKLKENIVENIIKDFFLIVSKHSKQYSYVSFYGFGIFREKKIKPKYVKLPNKKKRVKTKEKSYLVFKSSFEI